MPRPSGRSFPAIEISHWSVRPPRPTIGCLPIRGCVRHRRCLGRAIGRAQSTIVLRLIRLAWCSSCPNCRPNPHPMERPAPPLQTKAVLLRNLPRRTALGQSPNSILHPFPHCFEFVHKPLIVAHCTGGIFCHLTAFEQGMQLGPSCFTKGLP